ncbi:uncharacterized protein BDV17DRAFT_270905 [Aspergillus undulatus]|uniref:uncharacterized protein n=1 Tax=Aspergillus undulatus TaxID=1810928 RepID=UPI003CCCCFF9
MQKSDHYQWPCDLGFGSKKVGHLLDDPHRNSSSNHDTTGQISLRVATTSVRTSGRPQHSIDEKPSFRDDCAFLLVKECDLHAFQRVVSNVNPFYMIPDLPG